MRLITKDTDYAIRALCYIAKGEGDVVTVKDMTRCLKVPGPFLRKILQLLNKEKIVNSYKGKGGGFSLARDSREISVLELIEIFQGAIKLNEHTIRNKVCPEVRGCPLKVRLDSIEEHIKYELNSITLYSLIKEWRKGHGEKKDHKDRRG